MSRSRFVERLDVSLDERIYNDITGSNGNMESTEYPTNTSPGLPAAPREMFHEASYRPFTIYDDNRRATENEMAGFGADGADQQQKEPDYPPPRNPEDEDDDLNVTEELQQPQGQEDDTDLFRCNSFDFVVNRSNELAEEDAAAQGMYNPNPRLADTSAPRRPARAYTANGVQHEDIEMRDLLAPKPTRTQTQAKPEHLSLRKNIWTFLKGVCDAYSDVVMKEK